MPQGGTATPIAPSLVARARDGIRYIISGVTPATWFGPFQPLQPQAPPEVAGRQFDYPVGYNLEILPRGDEPISFAQLRALADGCDLLRLVIETRKDQIERLQWNIRRRDSASGEPARVGNDPRIAEIENFFRMPDRMNFWSSWLRLVLEDVFVIDAPALYLRRDRGGRLYALEPIDGATVKRLIDAGGRTPVPPDPAYQQVLHGLPAVDLTMRDLIYRPRNGRAHRIYGYSPVEQIVMTVNIAMRRQLFQLSYYTEGNVPEALIGTPESWGPNQIKEFQQYWDALLEGNLAQRRHAKFVPGGVAKTFIPTKEVELKSLYDEWLARVICYAFSVSPQPFIDRINRATAESAQEAAAEEGLAPIQNWIKQLVDYVIVTEFAAPDLEFQWRDDRDTDPQVAASVAQTYVVNGIKSVNEVRGEIGLDPVAGGEAPLILTGTEPVALEDAAKGAPGQAMASGGGAGTQRAAIASRRGAAEQVKASGLDRAPASHKAGFNPDQPRDADGRWTDEGGGDSPPADDGSPTGNASASDAESEAAAEPARGPRASDVLASNPIENEGDPSSPVDQSRSADQEVAFTGILIDSRYDEVANITHCTYSTPLGTFTIEYKGFFSCPETLPVPM